MDRVASLSFPGEKRFYSRQGGKKVNEKKGKKVNEKKGKLPFSTPFLITFSFAVLFKARIEPRQGKRKPKGIKVHAGPESQQINP